MKQLFFFSAFLFAAAALQAQSAAEVHPASDQKSAVLSQQPAIAVVADSTAIQAPDARSADIPAPAVSQDIIIPAEGQKSDAVKKPD